MFVFFLLIRVSLAKAITMSRPLSLASSLPLNPPPASPIKDFSLSSGAITSGLELAPPYSPIRARVGPYTRPPLANGVTATEATSPSIMAMKPAAIPAPANGI